MCTHYAERIINQLTLPRCAVHKYGSRITTAHWVTGSDTVFHKVIHDGQGVCRISDIHTCSVGDIAEDTICDVRVKVCNIQCEWNMPGENQI